MEIPYLLYCRTERCLLMDLVEVPLIVSGIYLFIQTYRHIYKVYAVNVDQKYFVKLRKCLILSVAYLFRWQKATKLYSNLFILCYEYFTLIKMFYTYNRDTSLSPALVQCKMLPKTIANLGSIPALFN